MGFTTPCFIREDTEYLRKKLKKLGYTPFDDDKRDGLVADKSGYMYSILENNLISSTYNCGTNEELFLAIAALRDDTNENQWFVADSPLSVSYDDTVGNDHYFTEPKGSVFFWDENWNHATIISGNYHKATVKELIEHFKEKEVNHG